MSLQTAPRAVSKFEAFHARLVAELNAVKRNLPGVSDQEFAALVDKLGGHDKVDALARAMPDQPTMVEMIHAFGSAEKLGEFTARTLGGNVAALAALAGSGCKRDPAKLAEIADAFADQPEILGDMLSQGGLGDHPGALAQVFGKSCDGDAGKLMAFCKTFDSGAKRADLRGVLDQGGLGQAPAALGALAGGDDGALLLKVAQQADRETLGHMLAGGGMGGRSPDHPDTLKVVLTDALGGDPARLMDLHAAFPETDGGMPQMRAFLQAMNGKSETGDAMAGKRMDALMKAFRDRDPGLSDADLAKRLYDPYFRQVSAAAADSRSATESGAGALGPGGAVIGERRHPPGGRLVLAALPTGGAADLLTRLAPDAEARARLLDAQDRLQSAAASAAALRKDTQDRAPDDAATKATEAAISAADAQRTALDGKPDGGSAKDIDTLTRAAEDCFTAAGAEPGGDLRRRALDAAMAAMASARGAMDRQTASRLAALKGADAQQSALAAAGAMAARVKDDPAASDGEKAAMQMASQAAAMALTASVLAIQGVDPGANPGAPEKPSDPDGSKARTEAATQAALSRISAMAAASAPVDPALLHQGAEAAQQVVQAGLATADQGARKAALAAGKALSDAVARQAAQIAASAELAMAFAEDAAEPALLVVNDIAAEQAALERDLDAAGPGADATRIQTELDQLGAANKTAARSALAMAELTRIDRLSHTDMQEAARDRAIWQARQDGTTPEIAMDAANELARKAAIAAKDAADMLAVRPVPVDPAFIRAASNAAQDAASAALGATEKPRRDMALSEGRRAGEAATRALAENARHRLDKRTRAKLADAVASSATARASANAFAANMKAGRAALDGALKTALADIGEAGASRLAELASTDGNVRSARAVAAKAAAGAGRPGASPLSKLLSVQADAQAQAAQATLAVAQATGAVSALAIPATPPWPPSGPPSPPPPHPKAPTESELRNATVLCDAAIAACSKWVSQATGLRDAATDSLRRADSIPKDSRNAQEADDHKKIRAMANPGDDTAGAPRMVRDAEAALIGLNAVTDQLQDKTQKLMYAAQIARIAIHDPPGNKFDAANTTTDPGDAGLENAAGFAAIIGTRGFKTVTLPDGSKPTFGPKGRDSLLATGANLARKALAADFANPKPPPPRLPMGDKAPMTGHPGCTLNLKHMCERHCRAHFTFAGTELEHEADILASAMLRARATGLSTSPALGAASDLFSKAEIKVKKIGSGKTTTMWPEGITADHIAAAATVALVEIKKDQPPGTGTFSAWLKTRPKTQHSKIIRAIKVGSHTLDVSLGVNSRGKTPEVNVVMFYPLGQESLTVADCHKLKSALGT